MISDMDELGNLKPLPTRGFKGKKINEGGLLTQFNDIRFIYINSETGKQVLNKATKDLLFKQSRLFTYIFLPNGMRTEGYPSNISDLEVRNFIYDEREAYVEDLITYTSEYPEPYKKFNSGIWTGSYSDITPPLPNPNVKPVYQIYDKSFLPDSLLRRDLKGKKYREEPVIPITFQYRLKDREVEKFTNKSISLKERIRAFKKIRGDLNRYGVPGNRQKNNAIIVKLEPPYSPNEYEKINPGYKVPKGILKVLGADGFFDDEEMNEYFVREWKSQADEFSKKKSARIDADWAKHRERVKQYLLDTRSEIKTEVKTEPKQVKEKVPTSILLAQKEKELEERVKKSIERDRALKKKILERKEKERLELEKKEKIEEINRMKRRERLARKRKGYDSDDSDGYVSDFFD
tara:strand:- start:2013 stop:3227 length:1215 start_codon:yes stop_codon:yes gene_type:complete